MRKPGWAQFSFADNGSLLEALVMRIAGQLRSGIARRSVASLVLSGGRTPDALLRRLAAEELDWAQVKVTLTDERWVPADHADSNARLVHNSLLQGAAQAAEFIPLYEAGVDPYVAAEAVNSRLAELALPLDVVLLGMGDDGHTASWFAGAAELDRALQAPDEERCCALTPPVAAHSRMTLTLPVIVNTRLLLLYIVGPQKLQTLQRAMVDGPVAELPVRAVLHQREAPLQIYYAERQ